LEEDVKYVNVLNLHRIDLARKYHTHLQREIEKEESRRERMKGFSLTVFHTQRVNNLQ
jgi:hypothetical protein